VTDTLDLAAPEIAELPRDGVTADGTLALAVSMMGVGSPYCVKPVHWLTTTVAPLVQVV
jgi:hypothetical protein